MEVLRLHFEQFSAHGASQASPWETLGWWGLVESLWATLSSGDLRASLLEILSSLIFRGFTLRDSQLMAPRVFLFNDFCSWGFGGFTSGDSQLIWEILSSQGFRGFTLKDFQLMRPQGLTWKDSYVSRASLWEILAHETSGASSSEVLSLLGFWGFTIKDSLLRGLWRFTFRDTQLMEPLGLHSERFSAHRASALPSEIPSS